MTTETTNELDRNPLSQRPARVIDPNEPYDGQRLPRTEFDPNDPRRLAGSVERNDFNDDRRLGTINRDAPYQPFEATAHSDATGTHPDANAIRENATKQREASKVRFEADQKSRAAIFERDQHASEARLNRETDTAVARAEAHAKVVDADRENDEKALNDGLLTHEDMLNRSMLHSQHPGALLPHQALHPDEGVVKMGFPRTVMLTMSASDMAPGIDNPAPIFHSAQVLFRKGYQDVPERLADHPYLYAASAYRLNGDKPEMPAERNKRIKEARENRKKAIRKADAA